MTRPGGVGWPAGLVGTLVWVALATAAIIVVARARYTTDLSAFLPRSPTPTQRLLVDQLREGLASRLMIVAIEGADSRTRARVSQDMARRLRSDPQFVSVNNGEAGGVDRDRAFLFSHRYLLSDTVTPQRFTVAGLRDAIQDTIDLLASPVGMLVKELLPRDPTGEMVEIISQLGSGGQPRTADGVWVSGAGQRALIVAQTRARGSDTDAQQRAVGAIRSAFAAALGSVPAASHPSAGETRKNSTVARDFETASPAEIASRDRRPLVMNYTREVVTQHGMAVDNATHAPQPAPAARAPGIGPAPTAAPDLATGTAATPNSAPSDPAAAARPAATDGAASPAPSAQARSAPTGAAAIREPLSLVMSGPGVFAVEARATIIKEVTRLSILSSAIVVALLLGVYRSATALVLGLVPVASGALAGIAAVALGLGVVHGITLGFGVTLIGEAVDYSIYLFIQSQQPAPDVRGESRQAGWQRSVWPTIRLGMLTSVCGFASLLPSGFAGLTQLGLYSIAGLVAAALVTRFVLPYWLPHNFSIRDVSPVGVAASRVLERIRGAPVALAVLALLAGGMVYLHRDTLWNRELSALSPVSQADQDLDAQLRVDIHAPDVRYLVVISGKDEEATLSAAEKVGAALNQLIDQDVIGGFDSPAHYLPSIASQRARQASLPPPHELRERLQQALEGLPVRPEKLEPFLADVAAAGNQPLLTRNDLENTSLGSGLDALLIQRGQQWLALLPLRASPSNPSYIDARRVRDAVQHAAPGQATLLDIKGEADILYSTYLSEAVRLSLAGFAAIVILLLITLRSPSRTLRVVIPLALAVLTVAGGFALIGRQLTLLHVIGMLLIVAVGSNYALFFDRRANDPHPGSVPLTLASLLVANVATVISFGILAFSTVPVLNALGSTVAPGAFLALIFSAVLARHLPSTPRPVPG
jgi:predicted exporter